MSLGLPRQFRVAVVNHNHNANALALKEGFSRYARTVLLDSGSDIETVDAPAFDRRLPNVYYSGLLNCAVDLAADLEPGEPLLFICSDVKVRDFGLMSLRIAEAFSRQGLEVYAPATRGSGHPQMWPRQSGGLRKVSFVEGFCFAATRRLLEQACPVDLAVNRLGWGIDVYLGYQAVRLGGYSTVDDRVEVDHPLATGYDTNAARSQRDEWYAAHPAGSRIYRRLATLPGFRGGPGYGLLRFLYAPLLHRRISAAKSLAR